MNIRGQSDRGAEDGLQPPDSALSHSSSTFICTNISYIIHYKLRSTKTDYNNHQSSRILNLDLWLLQFFCFLQFPFHFPQFIANQTEDLIFSYKSLLKIHYKSDLTLDGRVGSRLPPMLIEKSSESVQISRTMTPIESFANIPFVPAPPVFP